MWFNRKCVNSMLTPSLLPLNVNNSINSVNLPDSNRWHRWVIQGQHISAVAPAVWFVRSFRLERLHPNYFEPMAVVVIWQHILLVSQMKDPLIYYRYVSLNDCTCIKVRQYSLEHCSVEQNFVAWTFLLLLLSF